jgi:hypothetical protein
MVGRSVDKADCLGRYLVDNQQAPVYFHPSPSTPSKCGANYQVYLLFAICDAMCVIKNATVSGLGSVPLSVMNPR